VTSFILGGAILIAVVILRKKINKETKETP
jgi:hypothetical protein